MKIQKTLPKQLVAGAALAAIACLALAPALHASSHSDAPLIKLDPQANLTDVYAFIRTRPNGQRVLVAEVSVRPFSEPGDGPSYEAFSDDARYSIHIADPATGADLQRYDFQFSPVGINGNYKNLNTTLRYGRGANQANGNPDAGPIMTVGDNHQNFVQSYTVTRVVGDTSTVLNGTATLLVPPANVGPRTTPLYNDTSGTPGTNPNFGRAISGANSAVPLDSYTAQTRYDFTSGGALFTSFAGSREDGFYSDIPGIFDLLDPRILNNDGDANDGFGQDGNGVDGFKGFNVQHYAIVIPLDQLPSIPFNAPFTDGQAPGVGPRSGVGVYASVSRSRVTLRATNASPLSSGPFIQVNRLANPLFNELLVAIADKDNYNRTAPTEDAASFATYAMNPEVAALINAVVFGDPSGATPLVTSGRSDLAAVYIPDVIRLDTTTGPARVSGESGFNRLGFLGGDTLMTGSGQMISGGWPNGRRFGDDVVDVALTAVASGPSYSTITLLGDNVAANDQAYNQVFPYAGTPHSGTRNMKDSGVNAPPPPAVTAAPPTAARTKRRAR